MPMRRTPLNPPWSQPVCPACYEQRFLVKSKVFASWLRREKCIHCVADTDDGIYIDTRPGITQRNEGRPRPETGGMPRSVTPKEFENFSLQEEAWLRGHPGYVPPVFEPKK